MNAPELVRDIRAGVTQALTEDVGDGDLTAALVPADSTSKARVICREAAVLCGCDWLTETFAQLSAEVAINWQYHDSEQLAAGSTICTLGGPTRALLTGERTALNFLQLLSGTATVTRQTLEKMPRGQARLLDTRKTLPGLRQAQKYAVRCGGGDNHRLGLYDAVLIKENHIKAAGSVSEIVTQAKQTAAQVEVEVRTLDELTEAVVAGADIVLLDNFDLAEIKTAVTQTAGRAFLEVSGNADEGDLAELAATGIDYISIGALTKHVRAIDFSLLFE